MSELERDLQLAHLVALASLQSRKPPVFVEEVFFFDFELGDGLLVLLQDLFEIEGFVLKAVTLLLQLLDELVAAERRLVFGYFAAHQL